MVIYNVYQSCVYFRDSIHVSLTKMILCACGMCVHVCRCGYVCNAQVKCARVCNVHDVCII